MKRILICLTLLLPGLMLAETPVERYLREQREAAARAAAEANSPAAIAARQRAAAAAAAKQRALQATYANQRAQTENLAAQDRAYKEANPWWADKTWKDYRNSIAQLKAVMDKNQKEIGLLGAIPQSEQTQKDRDRLVQLREFIKNENAALTEAQNKKTAFEQRWKVDHLSGAASAVATETPTSPAPATP